MFVAGAGTGGTITGVARKLKERCPECIIVGVDPHGSILAQPESLNGITDSYKIEGIGYDFIPGVLDRSIVDRWLKTSDKESFLMSRRLIREEGILCGGSSGSAMAAAIKAAKELGPGKRCVVLLADSVRNYMTKFLNDDWMKANGFTDEGFVNEMPEHKDKIQYAGAKVKDLDLKLAVTVTADTPCSEAITIMQTNSFDQLPVTSNGTPSRLLGLVTLGNLLSRLSSGRATPSSSVSNVMFKFDGSKKFDEITIDTPLEGLTRFFERHSSAVVTEKGGEGLRVVHVVTKVDLLGWVVRNVKV